MTHPKSSASHKAENRLSFIDALRGLAALYVLFYHLALLPQPNLGVPNWAKSFVLTGGTGVTLFFVVSAFTLCNSMRNRQGEPISLARFYIRRIFRIVPLFYVWLAFHILRDVPSAWAYPFSKVALNAFFGFNFVPGQEQGIVPASWTLGVEMVFYLLFPFIFRCINDVRRALAFFFATVLVADVYKNLVASYALISAEEMPTFLHISFMHMLPIFACGILAFYISEAMRKRQLTQPINLNWAYVFIAGAALGYNLLLLGQLKFLLSDLYWQAVIYSGLLLGLSLLPWRVLVNRVTLFYGLISYSLYLNHPVIVGLLAPTYQKIYALPLPLTVQFGACVVVTLSILTPVSYLTYRLIEQPGMRLGNWLVKKIAA